MSLLILAVLCSEIVQCTKYLALNIQVEKKTVDLIPSVLAVLQKHSKVGTFFFADDAINSKEEFDRLIGPIKRASCQYGYKINEEFATDLQHSTEEICKKAIEGCRRLGPDAQGILFPLDLHKKSVYRCCRDNGLAFVASDYLDSFPDQLKDGVNIVSLSLDQAQMLSDWMQENGESFSSILSSRLEFPHFIFMSWWKETEEACKNSGWFEKIKQSF